MDIKREELEKDEILTEEERLAKEAEEAEATRITNQQNYKLLNHYVQTDEFKSLCDKFTKKGDKLTKEVEKLIKARDKTEGTKSQMDKDINFRDFLAELIKSMGDSEAELILRKVFLEAYESVTSHILNKQEEGYDLPLFTEIDLVKQKRVDYLCVDQRIRRIKEGFAMQPKDEVQVQHPYES